MKVPAVGRGGLYRIVEATKIMVKGVIYGFKCKQAGNMKWYIRTQTHIHVQKYR